ncbi:TonB-linked SusC/RagA family outer membrane protein [Maribacter vaceletii]|uniref:TonB-linked SusC/RagA family outer membrane protein n=1 Tax=Maribacter vaceletii TaxID=1206816 RepID=A0A495ECU2_9FLAO|nr:TonB-dependent receptor [Maribacter vaceletii]RKR14373.1 TonB-linked SusC/RagA family outer membrane protein [Maribacter vaceletii]
MKLVKFIKKKCQPRTFLLALFWIASSSLGLAQDSTISGTVNDNTGQPLPGANVLVKGTTNGTQTDFDGNFTLNAPSNGTISVSYIGFVTQDVAINNQSTFTITLEEDASQLDEVVVVGYGSQKKSDLTGAVASVGSKDIDKYTYTSAANALQGRMAGVRVQSSGGAPNGSPNIVIRGSGTLSDAGPLYVIDGMITGNMNTLNPADIESISVLKDASASAIYGSRAANGVVIVTTKKGRDGNVSIDFETSVGVNKAINELNWANARQYADIVNMANDNDGLPRYPANDTQFDPNYSSDLYGESLRSATVINTSLRLSGGSENLRYSLSMNNFDNEGVVRYSDFKRTTIRSNVNFSKGKFKLDNTIGLNKTVNNPNPYFGKERNMVPTIRLRDNEGNWSVDDRAVRGITDTFSNFYGVSTNNTRHELAEAALEDRTITRYTAIGNIAASYEFFDGLTYKINGGLEYYSDNNYKFTPTYPLIPNNSGGFDYQNTAGGLRETNTNFISTLLEHTLNYKKTFGKHTVDLLGGFSEQINKSRSLGIVATGFVDENVRVASAASNLEQAPQQDRTSSLQSYFGRFNYNFDDRYLLTATLRRDGSSLFRKELQWGTFPSFAVGWNISNEKFMEDVTSITDIKLRGSYGEIGSNNVAIYSIDPSLNLFSTYVLGTGDQQRVDGYAITNGVNANIIWETTKTTDVGLEFRLLDSRLGVTLDYFIKDSEDVLVSLDPAFYTGFGNTIPENSASIRNKGFEFTANYSGNVGELGFNVSANFSTLNNEVTSLGARGTPVIAGSFTSNTINSTKTDIGHPISSFFGYIVDGIYQTDAEAAAANDTGGNQVAGDLKFKDIAGPDGSAPDGMIDENDQTFIGNPTPDFEYGINLALDYKNFDLNLFFNGVSGNEILNGSKYRGIFDTDGNYLTDALNAWTPSNTDTNIPRMTQLDQGNNRRMSTFYLENGSFFRLANAQIGYSIPNQILDKINVSKIRLFVSATNLFTITDYTGYYPEVGNNSRTGSVRLFNSGVDEAAYPTPRTFQAGLQVSF